MWWWVWISLELRSWLFLNFIREIESVLFFLSWQRVSSLFLLLRWLYLRRELICRLSLMLKIGLPPFHYLIIQLSNFIKIKILILFLFVHKYLPLIFLLNTSFITLIWWFLICMLTITLIVWLFRSLKMFIVRWCLCDISWFVWSFNFSSNMLILYLLLNLLVIKIFINIRDLKVFKGWCSIQNWRLALLFMIGLPPFSSFTVKWVCISTLPIIVGLLSTLVAVIILIIMWIYFYCTILYSRLKFNLKSFFNWISVSQIFWIVNI